MEDIRSAVQFLKNLKGVDPKRIGALGICDSELAGISGRLEQGSQERNDWKQSGKVEYIGNLIAEHTCLPKEALEKIPAGLYRDGVEYYGCTHYHPHSQSRYTAMSLMDLMSFDAENHVDLIRQPLLMMAGDIADPRYMTEGVFEKATGTQEKELVLIKGAHHIETYWEEEFV